MKITLKDLDKTPRYGDRACEDARDWFAKTFPDGTTKDKALAACPRGDWLIWALWNFNLATIEQIIMLGCVAGRRSLRFAREQDKAVLVAAFDAADAVADDNTEKNRVAAGAAKDAAMAAAWAAMAAAWAARDAARAAAGAAKDAEHLSCADAMRKMMRTARYKRAGMRREKQGMK